MRRKFHQLQFNVSVERDSLSILLIIKNIFHPLLLLDIHICNLNLVRVLRKFAIVTIVCAIHLFSAAGKNASSARENIFFFSHPSCRQQIVDLCANAQMLPSSTCLEFYELEGKSAAGLFRVCATIRDPEWRRVEKEIEGLVKILRKNS